MNPRWLQLLLLHLPAMPCPTLALLIRHRGLTQWSRLLLILWVLPTPVPQATPHRQRRVRARPGEASPLTFQDKERWADLELKHLVISVKADSGPNPPTIANRWESNAALRGIQTIQSVVVDLPQMCGRITVYTASQTRAFGLAARQTEVIVACAIRARLAQFGREVGGADPVPLGAAVQRPPLRRDQQRAASIAQQHQAVALHQCRGTDILEADGAAGIEGDARLLPDHLVDGWQARAPCGGRHGQVAGREHRAAGNGALSRVLRSSLRRLRSSVAAVVEEVETIRRARDREAKNEGKRRKSSSVDPGYNAPGDESDDEHSFESRDGSSAKLVEHV